MGRLLFRSGCSQTITQAEVRVVIMNPGAQVSFCGVKWTDRREQSDRRWCFGLANCRESREAKSAARLLASVSLVASCSDGWFN